MAKDNNIGFGLGSAATPQQQLAGQPGTMKTPPPDKKGPSKWVVLAIALAVAAGGGLGAAALLSGGGEGGGEGGGSGTQAEAPAVDTSRIEGMESLAFLDDAAKMRLASEMSRVLMAEGYSWPCTVKVLDKAEQIKTGGTKIYFLTGEGKAWIVLYSPTSASEFSISELTTTVEGVNDDQSLAEAAGDSGESASASGSESAGDATVPRGSGYTEEGDSEPEEVEARPASSGSDSSSGSTGSTGSASSGSSGSGSTSSTTTTTTSSNVKRIAKGTVKITDAEAMEAFLPADAAAVFAEASGQCLDRWSLTAADARACKGSESKSGGKYKFNMTAGSHAVKVTYDAGKCNFHYQILY